MYSGVLSESARCKTELKNFSSFLDISISARMRKILDTRGLPIAMILQTLTHSLGRRKYKSWFKIEEFHLRESQVMQNKTIVYISLQFTGLILIPISANPMQVLFGAFQRTTISKNTHSHVSRTLKISVQLNNIKMINRCDLTF